MSSLDRKLLRDLKVARYLIAGVVSIIAVGVMCFIYMSATHRNLDSAMRRYYTRSRMADFWVDLKKAPASEVDALAELNGILEVNARVQSYVAVDLDDEPAPINGLVLSLPDERKPIINDMVLKRGTYFTERRQDEVIVSDVFARHHGIGPGDKLHLILNGRRQELIVVGTSISCEFVYLVNPGSITPDPQHFGVFYLKKSFAEHAFDLSGAANQVLGRLTPEARGRPDAVIRRVESVLAPYGVLTTTLLRDHASNRFLSDEIRGLGVFATMMPLIFMGVAALVLNVSMVRLVEQQRTVIGTLKALGYSDHSLLSHFAKFGALTGLVGALIGMVLGYFMAELVTWNYGRFFEFPDLYNRLYPDTYAGGLAIGLTGSVVGSVLGARAVLELSPAQAMRPKSPARGGPVCIERATWLWRRLNFAWRLVMRTALRDRLRTAAGILATTTGAGLLVCSFILDEGLHHLINFQFEKITLSDVHLGFNDERGLAMLFEVARLPGVDRAEPVMNLACTFMHGPRQHRGSITGIESDAMLIVPRDRKGRSIPIPTVGLVMSRKMAELLDAEPGDTVTVVPIKGRRDELRVRVASLTESYIGTSVYADIRYLGFVIGETLAINGAQLKVDPRPTARNLLNRELKRLPALRSVSVRTDVIKNLNDTFVVTQEIFVSLLQFFAGIVFFCSLLTTSLVGLSQREREVANLLAMGFGKWQVGSLFLRESVLINSIGTATGLPLGYFISTLVAAQYDTELFRFPVVTSPGIFLKCIIMSLVFAATAHAVVQRNVNHLDWLGIIRASD